MRGVEVSAIGAEQQFRRLAAAGAAEHGDHAGHGIRAVERALRAAQQFDAVHALQGNGAKVEGPAGFVHWNSVDNDFVVVGVTTAYEQGRQSATLAGVTDDDAGKEADCIRQAYRLHVGQLPGLHS